MAQHKTILERIDACEKILNGSQKPDMLPLLDPYVTAESVAPGLELLTEAKTVEREQRRLENKRKAASAKFSTELDAAARALSATRKLAKVLGRNYPEVLQEIGLTESVPGTQKAWIKAATEFYEDVLDRDDLITVVQNKGLNRARLEREQNKVLKLPALHEAAESLDAQRQQHTKDRDAKLWELEDFCVEILVLAEEALREQGKPQLLERLGKVVR